MNHPAIIETYTISDPEDIYWDVGGIITDALTGIQYAVSRDGKRRVALNVPLAACCDEPVELCACLAPVTKLSSTRIAA